MSVNELYRLRLPDGRLLAWASYGCQDGIPIIALHGTPGSHLKFELAADAAQALGLRLIAVDRWGYGGSGRPTVPTLSRYAEDIARLVVHIDAPRTGVIGVSGGGPFAVAVAAGLGARAGALALVATVGPIAGGPDDVRLGPFHLLCFRVLPRIPGAIRLTFAGLKAALAVSPRLALGLAAARASPADRRMSCTADARVSLAESFRLGLAPGLDGPVIDMALLARPWDIDLAAVSAPARLWLGDQDHNVPGAAARSLARLLPTCELTVLPGHGHYWITQNYPEVLSWVAAALETQNRADHGPRGMKLPSASP